MATRPVHAGSRAPRTSAATESGMGPPQLRRCATSSAISSSARSCNEGGLTSMSSATALTAATRSAARTAACLSWIAMTWPPSVTAPSSWPCLTAVRGLSHAPSDLEVQRGRVHLAGRETVLAGRARLQRHRRRRFVSPVVVRPLCVFEGSVFGGGGRLLRPRARGDAHDRQHEERRAGAGPPGRHVVHHPMGRPGPIGPACDSMAITMTAATGL